jgi:hypothetical protein
MPTPAPQPALVLATTNPDGSWSPGIGDPTVWGWLITLAYLVAGVLAIVAWRREDWVWLGGGRGLRPRVWLVVGVVLLLLCANKQLDLQSLVTVVGRRLAKEQGWYGRHRAVQGAFVGLVALGVLLAAGLLLRWVRGTGGRYALALLGMGALAAFVIVRAASFHHVDQFLFKTGVGPFMNRGLELLGIGIVGVAAWRILRAGTRDPRAQTPRSQNGRGV